MWGMIFSSTSKQDSKGYVVKSPKAVIEQHVQCNNPLDRYYIAPMLPPPCISPVVRLID